MFEYAQVGKEIKTWAKIGAWITLIPYLLIGIFLIILAFLSGEFGLFLLFLLIAAVVIGLGYLFARLSSMMLYGAGELIDHVMAISIRVMRIEDNLKDKVIDSVKNEKPQQFADGSWICTCGRRNPSYVSSCSCGVSKWDIK